MTSQKYPTQHVQDDQYTYKEKPGILRKKMENSAACTENGNPQDPKCETVRDAQEKHKKTATE